MTTRSTCMLPWRRLAHLGIVLLTAQPLSTAAYECSAITSADVIRQYKGLIPGMTREEFRARASALGCVEAVSVTGLKLECASCNKREELGFCLEYDKETSVTTLFEKPVTSISYIQNQDGQSKITIHTFQADASHIGKALATHHGSTYAGDKQLMTWCWPGGKTWWGGETTLHLLRHKAP